MYKQVVSRFCIIAMSLASLVACSSNSSRLTKYDPQAHNLENKAVIVLKSQNVDYFDLCKYETATAQEDDEPADRFRIFKPSSFFTIYSYSDWAYVIEPGFYYIDFAYYDGTSTNDNNSKIYFTRADGISKEGILRYGGFNVKAGEVLFLGDIKFDWLNQNKNDFITIGGNLADVKADLKAAGRKDLAKRIIFTKFYKKGDAIEP